MLKPCQMNGFKISFIIIAQMVPGIV